MEKEQFQFNQFEFINFRAAEKMFERMLIVARTRDTVAIAHSLLLREQQVADEYVKDFWIHGGEILESHV